MARLTRQERGIAVAAGLLLGGLVGFFSQIAGLGIPASIGLCVIGAAGLGAWLASGKHGIW